MLVRKNRAVVCFEDSLPVGYVRVSLGTLLQRLLYYSLSSMSTSRAALPMYTDSPTQLTQELAGWFDRGFKALYTVFSGSHIFKEAHTVVSLVVVAEGPSQNVQMDTNLNTSVLLF